MLYCFNLDDYKSEQDVLDVVELLGNEVIDACFSERGRIPKIRRVKAKVDKLNAKCKAMAWKEAIKEIDKWLKQVSAAENDLDSNMIFSIR